MNILRSRFVRTGRMSGLILILIAFSGAAAWLGTSSSRHASAAKSITNSEAAKLDAIKRVGIEGLIVPADAATRLGLRSATAALPSQLRALPPFSGTLAVDNNSLSRVCSRFPGEVISLGTAPDALPTRTLRVGDKVAKGQTLAVVSSTLLGEKKSELLDALSKLRRDQDILASLKDPAISFASTPRSIRDAERDVESDRVAVGRAELALRSWQISGLEIEAIRTEAAELAKPGSKPSDPAAWPRSVVSSPRDGVIIELNTNATIVDTMTPMVLVADLSHLAVWAHVYEEDLPLFEMLPRPLRWTVNIPSRPESAYPGTLDSIGAVIHPDQHTALISGTVANPNGSLRAGMYITVTIEMPSPRGEVEMPAEALIEDGRESLVFVRSSSDPSSITRHRVKVVRRNHDAVYLLANASGIRAGDEVITSGSLLLNEAMNELPVPRP